MAADLISTTEARLYRVPDAMRQLGLSRSVIYELMHSGRLRSILVRAISHAQARDKVKRNVALLCEIPRGKEGRRRHVSR
ncbi:hypothetical protein AB0395_35735 [Streptosporangium sp. NPDC051023]|uniref:hypothetical protein n=1 Tax=Streptosporangium sp. NPDC051023 TaxID=3155410 RepID=UPI00344C4538